MSHLSWAQEGQKIVRNWTWRETKGHYSKNIYTWENEAARYMVSQYLWQNWTKILLFITSGNIGGSKKGKYFHLLWFWHICYIYFQHKQWLFVPAWCWLHSVFGQFSVLTQKVVVCKGGEPLTIRRVIRGDWRRPTWILTPHNSRSSSSTKISQDIFMADFLGI